MIYLFFALDECNFNRTFKVNVLLTLISDDNSFLCSYREGRRAQKTRMPLFQTRENAGGVESDTKEERGRNSGPSKETGKSAGRKKEQEMKRERERQREAEMERE